VGAPPDDSFGSTCSIFFGSRRENVSFVRLGINVRTSAVRAPSDLLRAVSDESALVKRLMWSGLVAGVGALAAIAANRVATVVWRRVFNEDPPD
jgi:hypothetical protein